VFLGEIHLDSLSHATKGSTCQDETRESLHTESSKRQDTIKTKLRRLACGCCYTCAARAKVAVDMSCVLHLARVVVVPALRSFVRPTLFAVGRYKR
jgi:hypothetical protein